MKTDATKRKIFMDAVDLLSSGEQAATGNGIEMLDIDVIKPFRHHHFHLYEGEWLDDMVESIKEHGVLNVEQLKAIDSRYFNIITVDEYDVTIQSRNAGHYWYLYCTGVSGMRHVLFSININTAIPITSMGVETALDRLYGAARAIGGR